MFNIQGSELIFLLLVALVVLGPEKLPEAIRKATKAYTEFKKMANGFQGEFRDVLEEPMRELRGTADALREAAKFEFDLDDKTAATPGPRKATSPEATPAAAEEPAPEKAPIVREAGLNFGSANPRRQPPPEATSGAKATQGLNFGNANARRQTRIARSDAPVPTTDAHDAPAVDAPMVDGPAPAEDGE